MASSVLLNAPPASSAPPPAAVCRATVSTKPTAAALSPPPLAPPPVAVRRESSPARRAVRAVLDTQGDDGGPAALPWWAWVTLPLSASMGDEALPRTSLGHLYVRVLEARGLVAYEPRHPAGSSSAFAEVALGQHAITSQTTRVIPHSLSPAWDEAFLLAAQSPFATLRVTLWHHAGGGGCGGGERKQPLGEVLLPLSLLADGHSHDMWLALRPCGARAGEEGTRHILAMLEGDAPVGADAAAPPPPPPPTAVLAAVPHRPSLVPLRPHTTPPPPPQPDPAPALVPLLAVATHAALGARRTALIAPREALSDAVQTTHATQAREALPGGAGGACSSDGCGGSSREAVAGGAGDGAPRPPDAAAAAAARSPITASLAAAAPTPREAPLHCTPRPAVVVAAAAAAAVACDGAATGDPRSAAADAAPSARAFAPPAPLPARCLAPAPAPALTAGTPAATSAAATPQQLSRRAPVATARVACCCGAGLLGAAGAAPLPPDHTERPAGHSSDEGGTARGAGCGRSRSELPRTPRRAPPLPRRRWLAAYRRLDGSLDWARVLAGVPARQLPGAASSTDALRVLAPLLFQGPEAALVAPERPAEAAAAGSADAACDGEPQPGSLTFRTVMREHAALYELYPRLADAAEGRAADASGELAARQESLDARAPGADDAHNNAPGESMRTHAALATLPCPHVPLPAAPGADGGHDRGGGGGGGAAHDAPQPLPPLLLSSGLSHHYGLGRVRLQLQLRFDPLAELHCHLAHFECAPAPQAPAYSAALLVHNSARLYALVAPPLTAALQWLWGALMWHDAAATLTLVGFVVVWARHSWALPALLHAVLLRHIIAGYARLHLRRVGTSLHAPFAEPPRPPTVALGVALLQLPGAATAVVPGPVALAAVAEAGRLMACSQQQEEEEGAAAAGAEEYRPVQEMTEGGAAEKEGVGEGDGEGGRSRAVSPSARRSAARERRGGCGRALQSLAARALRIARGSGVRAPILLVDEAARERLRALCFAVGARLLGRMRDTQSSNTSFVLRTPSAQDSRTTVAEHLGMPSRPTAAAHGRRAPGGQLVAVGDVLSSVSLRAVPAVGTPAECRVCLPAVSELVPPQATMPAAGTADGATRAQPGGAAGAPAGPVLSGVLTRLLQRTFAVARAPPPPAAAKAGLCTGSAAAHAPAASSSALNGGGRPIQRTAGGQRVAGVPSLASLVVLPIVDTAHLRRHTPHPDEASSGVDAVADTLQHVSRIGGRVSRAGGACAAGGGAVVDPAHTQRASQDGAASLYSLAPHAASPSSLRRFLPRATAVAASNTDSLARWSRDTGTAAASTAYSLAPGLEPLTLDVPRGTRLLLVAPNAVIHAPWRLAAAAELLPDSEEGAAAALARALWPPAAASLGSGGGGGGGSGHPVLAAFPRRTRYTLLLAAVSDYLTPGRPAESLARLQNSIGSLADELTALGHCCDWSVPPVTLGLVCALALSAAACALFPQRALLAALPLALVAVQTRPARAAAGVLLGLASYAAGSLARTPWAPGRAKRTAQLLERAAACPRTSALTAALGASGAVHRAAALPAHDVLSDVVLDALLVRPQGASARAGGVE